MSVNESGRCPLCGTAVTQRHSSTASDAPRNHYAVALAIRGQASGTPLPGPIETLECGACGLLSRQPYYTDSAVACVYLQDPPLHLAAWKTVGKVLRGKSFASYCAPEQLIELVADRLPTIRTYAEFGCPFQGFLVSDLRTRHAENRAKALIAGWRSPFLQRQYGLHLLGRAIAHRLVPLFRSRRRRVVDSTVGVARLGSERFIVVDDSTQRWGLACVNYGMSCWQLASCIPAVKIQTRAEVGMSLGSDRLSLLAFFDSLDHCTDLSGVVSWALSHADAILIVAHKVQFAGLQHRFVLTPAAIQYIAKLSPGWTAVDLGTEDGSGLERSHLWYLLVRDTKSAAA